VETDEMSGNAPARGGPGDGVAATGELNGNAEEAGALSGGVAEANAPGGNAMDTNELSGITVGTGEARGNAAGPEAVRDGALEQGEIISIETRLGRRDVSADKVILFPRGLIGFEGQREFTLLQIQENAPLLLLQSMQTPALGLLVADPYVFIPEYGPAVGDIEQELLQAKNVDDIAVLVTASIPPGKPEDAVLNLLGPILVNHTLRLGLQVPQFENSGPPKVRIRSRIQPPEE
jgi:flagellar assembly factor FliW